MRILCTGNAGMMGSWLCDKLIEKGHSVIGVDNLSGGLKENINDKVEQWYDDLRDEKAVNKILDYYYNNGKIDALFHLAADATEGRSQFTPKFCVENNTVAFVNLAKAAIKTKVPYWIVASSMACYGDQKSPFDESLPRNPVDVYAWCKSSIEGMTEIFSDVYDFRYTIIRPHNLVGKRQFLYDSARNVLAIWVNCLLRDKNYFVYGDGSHVRSWSYLGDVIDAMVNCLDRDVHGQIINLGAKTPNTLNELSVMVREEFEKVTGKKTPDPVYLQDRPREVAVAYSTVQKSIDLLGYKETKTLREAVREFIEWAYKKYPYGVKPVYSVPLELVNEKTPRTWVDQLI